MDLPSCPMHSPQLPEEALQAAQQRQVHQEPMMEVLQEAQQAVSG